MSGDPERGRWQRDLQEHCRVNGLETPIFEPYKIENHQDGRTHLGWHVCVGNDRFSSRPSYPFSNIYTARDQAAELIYTAREQAAELIYTAREEAAQRALETYRSRIQHRSTQGHGAESPERPIQQNPTNILHQAVRTGDHDAVKRSLQDGALVNERLYQSSEASPLLIAISRRDQNAVRTLLEAGADITDSNVLEAAIRADAKEILQILIDSGADVNYGDPLLLAIRRGRKDIVDLLLQAGADVNSGNTLKAPVQHGDIDILQALLEAGADALRSNILNEAVEHGDIEILKALLEAGANVNHGDILLDAIYRGRKDFVKLLLQAGADVNQNSALATSARKGDTEVVRMLLDAGADANMPCTDRPYGSPLVAAIMSGRESIVKTIITAGADVNMHCTNGKHPSPLVAAIRESDTTEKWLGFSRAARSRIVGLLLEYGADVNLQLADDRCRNALDAALDIKDDQIIRTILIAGAHVANTSNGVTITCPWELPHILLSDTEKVDVFNVPTLTKKDEGVTLATCAEYLERLYGKQGIKVFEDIMCALNDPDSVHVSKGIIFRATSEQLIARFPASMKHLLDAVAWICLTFRQPPPNGPQISTGAFTEGRFIFNPWEPLRELTMSDNTCWSALFDTAVIAVESSTGLNSDWMLDSSYPNMIQLAAVEYPVLVDNGIVLMGYSTALIPVRRNDKQTIEWHLEVATHDGQFNISELTVTKGPWLRTQDMNELRSKRNLLGWCANAKVALGTIQAADIKRSGARTKHTSWQWTGANLQLVGQSGGPAQVGGQLGLAFSRKMMAVHFSPSDNYLKCLRNSISEQMIVYDTTQQRAWLIPLVCVLHQMLLSYAKGHGLTSGVPETTSENNNGGLASFEALKDKALSAVDNSSNLQLTVRDLIMGFSVNLSKALLQKPSGPKIYGYEFWDIIEDSTQSDLKQQRLERQGLAWAPLLGEIKCLFCSNFGDAIVGRRAVCADSPCNRVPDGQDLMAASVCSVTALLERHGPSLRFNHCSNILAESHFQQCSHNNRGETCWKSPVFLQDMRAPGRGSAVKTDTYPNGAVVFGRRERDLSTFFKFESMRVVSSK